MTTKIWISFKDEKDRIIEGYFEKVSETLPYIKLKTRDGNILTIPFHRINKIKENSR